MACEEELSKIQVLSSTVGPVEELDLENADFAIAERNVLKSVLNGEPTTEGMSEGMVGDLAALLRSYIPNVDAHALMRSGDYEAMALYAPRGGEKKVVIGACAYRPHTGGEINFVELALFCTDIACQGKGFGGRLMRKLEDRCRDEYNAKCLFAYADIKAYAFFSRLGFSRTIQTEHHHWKNKIVNYNDAAIVEKILDGSGIKRKKVAPNAKVECNSGLPNCYCRTGRTRAIELYDNVTGEVQERFCSAAAASRRFGLAMCSVTHVCNGYAHSTQGRYFRYYKDLPFITGGPRAVVRVKLIKSDTPFDYLLNYSPNSKRKRKNSSKSSSSPKKRAASKNVIYYDDDADDEHEDVEETKKDVSNAMDHNAEEGAVTPTAEEEEEEDGASEKKEDEEKKKSQATTYGGDSYTVGAYNQWKVVARYPSAVAAAIGTFGTKRSLNGAIGNVCNGTQDDVHGKVFRWADDRVHPCAICGTDADASSLMLCDGIDHRCVGTAHYQCLGLPSLPEGDWFCPACDKRGKVTNVHLSVPHNSHFPFKDYLNEVDDVAVSPKDDAPKRKKLPSAYELFGTDSEDEGLPVEFSSSRPIRRVKVKMPVIEPPKPKKKKSPIRPNKSPSPPKKKKKKKKVIKTVTVGTQTVPEEKKTPPPPKKKKKPPSTSTTGGNPLEGNDVGILVQVANPKRPDSKSYLRYEQYKAATTTGEFLDLGGTRGDLNYDYAKGFITLTETPATTPATVPPPVQDDAPPPVQPGDDDVHMDVLGSDESLWDNDPAFWDNGPKCHILNDGFWYPGTLFQCTTTHAIIHYDRYPGVAAVVDLENERFKVKWDT